MGLWEDEYNVYWERLTSFAVNKNYDFLNRSKSPAFSINDLDELFNDFIDFKNQLLPSKERFIKMLQNEGNDPRAFFKERIEKIKNEKILLLKLKAMSNFKKAEAVLPLFKY